MSNPHVESAPRTSRAKRRKRKFRTLVPWQWAVLGILLAAVLFVSVSDLMSRAQLRDIAQQREKAQQEYERRVYRTTVKNRDLITKYAAQYAIHPAYLAAIILNESSYDKNAVSSVGARGLMQLLPTTGEWIAPKIGIAKADYNDDLLFDADINVHMGAWYISYLSDKYDGDPLLIACAYHAGAGNVDSWINKFSTDGKTLTLAQIPYDNSRSYAGKVVASYAIYLENYYPDARADACVLYDHFLRVCV